MYLPFVEEPRMVAMGLRPLKPSQWIEPDHEWSEFHEHKRNCFASLPERCLLTLDGSQFAQEELRERLHSHLLADHPSVFSEGNGEILHRASSTTTPSSSHPPIKEAALWIQDDLCILEDTPSGYLLTAAALCSPSFWHLEEKIGKPLDEIHLPVPGYQAGIAQATNRFFEKLVQGKPFWRLNWSVVANRQLMQRLDQPATEPAEEGPLWLRVERQTLTRLPKTKAICFTIRIHRYSLEEVLSDPKVSSSFDAAIKQLSPEELTYKSLSRVKDRLNSLGHPLSPS